MLVCLYGISTQQLYGQRNLTLHSMAEIPQANQTNPGLISPYKWHLHIPLFSSFNIGGGNSALQLKDLGVTDYRFAFELDYEKLMPLITNVNRTYGDLNWDILGFGFRQGDNFFSFTVRENIYFQSNLPPDFFEVANDVEQELFITGKTYNLQTLSFHMAHYRSYEFGYARKVMKGLTAGVKVKYLAGLESIWTNNTGLTFINSGDIDVFDVNGRIEVLSAGLSILAEDNDFDWGQYLFGGGNYGLAFDVGANYKISDEVELGLSAINLGFLTWKNDVNYYVTSTQVEDTENLVDDVVDQLIEEEAPTTVRYRTPLTSQLFFSGKYHLKPTMSVGMLLNPRFYENNVDLAAAVSYNIGVKNWLDFTTNYSIYHNSFFNIGTGISLNLGAFQMYFITNNLPGLIAIGNAQNLHVNAGLNLNFGRIEEVEDAVADSIQFEMDGFPLVKREQEEEVFPTNVKPSTNPLVMPTKIRNKYVMVQGYVKDEISGDQLQHIYVDVYKLSSEGLKELVRTDRYLIGQFEVPVERGYDHLFRIIRQGFEPLDFEISASDINASGIQLIKNFFLAREREYSRIAKTEEKKSPSPSTSRRAPSANNFNASPKMNQKPGGSVFNEYVGTGEQFRVTQRTSFRSRATSQSEVLLRFHIGDTVEVLEKLNRYWWKVRFNRRVGYVKQALLVPVQ